VRRPLHFFALLAMVCSLFVAACGDDSGDKPAGSGTSTAESTPAAKSIKVGLVTDIGGLNDRSFNQLANEGLERAKSELGVDTKVLVSKSDADYIPNLSTLAQQKYDLVVGVGFLMADAVNTVASKFPDTKFAVVDVDATTLKDKPTNVAGLLFKEQEAGYLVGYMSGLYLKDNGGGTAGSVGGQKIPPVDHYIAGYQKGVKDADPDAKVVNGYSQKFDDPAPCKELALNQIADGAKVIFQVAGGCGLGALDAAKGKGVQGIGVDADQAYLGDHIMTSALKKVDVAVEDTVKAVQDNSYKGGANTIFDVKSGGVGIGKTNSVGSKYEAQIKEVQDKIASGEITDIPDTVK
jgi:basic membrane protein A